MIYLDRKDIPPALLGSYTKTKLRAKPCTSVTIPADAGIWSHGTRDHYTALEMATGKMVPLPNQGGSPWDNNRSDRNVELRPGFAIVRSSVFCGKNLGLIYYVHPDDIVKLVPDNSTVQLSDTEKRVLRIIQGYKSFARNDEYRRAGIEAGEVEAIKARLIGLGLLNKAGAITTKGKNACEGVKL